jgi:hypothetical protein
MALVGVTLSLFQVADSTYPTLRAVETARILDAAGKSKDLDDSISAKDGENLDPQEAKERELVMEAARNIDETMASLHVREGDNWLSELDQEDDFNHTPRKKTFGLAHRVAHGQVSHDEFSELFKSPEKTDFPPTAITGFERLGSFNENARKVIQDFLPPKVLNCISQIEFIDHLWPNAQAFPDPNDSRWRLELYRGTKTDWSKGIEGLSSTSARSTLSHEAGHDIDYERSPLLSEADKIQFLAKILTRLHDRDRYRSGYVDIMKGLDRDPKYWTTPTVVNGAVEEYWAEIYALYLSGVPHNVKLGVSEPNLPEKDRDIVEWVMARTDPTWLSQKGANMPHYTSLEKQESNE